MNELSDDIKREGQKLESDSDFEKLLSEHEQEEEENPEDSSPEENSEDNDSEQSENNKEDDSDDTKDKASEKTEDKPLPFHKHPRWEKVQDELKELRQFKDNHESLPSKIDAIQEAQTQQAQPTKLPQWWVMLYGDDDLSATAFSEYNSHETDMRKQIKQEAIAEYQAAQDAQAAEISQWDAWVDNEIAQLQAEGHTFDRNALLKVATEWQPLDKDGNISFEKSLQILNMQSANRKKPTSDNRKKVAAMTNTSKGRTSIKTSTAPSMHDLRGKSMQELLHGK